MNNNKTNSMNYVIKVSDCMDSLSERSDNFKFKNKFSEK